MKETYYYHADHLGTPILMTDKNGGKVWNGEFLPYGENYSITGNVINNFRFPGQYADKETGLNQNWHRDFHPPSGTYRQKDPIGFLGGINLYSYGNNPVNFVDPLGLIKAVFGGGGKYNYYITIWSNDGNFLGQYRAHNECVCEGEVPSGTYNFGVPRGPRGKTNKATGNWFVPILGVRGMPNMGLHGGGTGLEDPFAPNQGWKKTLGCIRVQNEDLEKIVDFIKGETNNTITIFPKYPLNGASH